MHRAHLRLYVGTASAAGIGEMTMDLDDPARGAQHFFDIRTSVYKVQGTVARQNGVRIFLTPFENGGFAIQNAICKSA
jgi:hypothetical protein